MSDLSEAAERIRRALRGRGLALDDVAESIAPGVESLHARLRGLADELTPDDPPPPDRREPPRSP